MGRPWDRARSWLGRRYGRKQGAYRHFAAELQRCLGALAAYEFVQWARVRRLVFVCRGNICRSPYAEARALKLGMRATSFGLQADGRSGAYPPLVEAARLRGVDVSGHSSRVARGLYLGPEDLLVAMELADARHLEGWARPAGAQVTLLGLWGRPSRAHLEDPYRLGDGYLRTCLDLIDSALAGIARHQQAAPESGPAPGVST